MNTLNPTALQKFMERQGYEKTMLGNFEHYGILVDYNAAEKWYTTLSEALAPVEHDGACATYNSRKGTEYGCSCDADEINALLAERRKAAGL